MSGPPDPSTSAPASCIDARVGRASTNGNDALYLRLLVMFRAGQHDVVERFRAAWLEGDVVAAMRVAHNLRTGASTLGMTALAEVSTALEMVCRDGGTDLDRLTQLLDELPRVLAPVLAVLQRLSVSDPETLALLDAR